MCVTPVWLASARAHAARSSKSARTAVKRPSEARGLRASAITDQLGSASSVLIRRFDAAPPAPAIRAVLFIARTIPRDRGSGQATGRKSGSALRLTCGDRDSAGAGRHRLDLARCRRREQERGRVGESRGRLWLAEQITLQLWITLLAQERILLVGLHPFDRHLQIEFMC